MTRTSEALLSISRSSQERASRRLAFIYGWMTCPRSFSPRIQLRLSRSERSRDLSDQESLPIQFFEIITHANAEVTDTFQQHPWHESWIYACQHIAGTSKRADSWCVQVEIPSKHDLGWRPARFRAPRGRAVEMDLGKPERK